MESTNEVQKATSFLSQYGLMDLRKVGDLLKVETPSKLKKKPLIEQIIKIKLGLIQPYTKKKDGRRRLNIQIENLTLSIMEGLNKIFDVVAFDNEIINIMPVDILDTEPINIMPVAAFIEKYSELDKYIIYETARYMGVYISNKNINTQLEIIYNALISGKKFHTPYDDFNISKHTLIDIINEMRVNIELIA